MKQDDNATTIVIIEPSRCLIARNLDFDTAITVIALLSEDPADWDKAMSVWPRYRTPAVCEFASSLPFELVNQRETDTLFRVPDPSIDVSEPAMPQITTRESSSYSKPDVDAHGPAVPVVIDFRNKRVLTGGQFMAVGRDEAYAMVVDESGNQHWPMSIHLPPWWELHEGVSPEMVNEPRQSPIKKPHVDRDVLYCDAFQADIANTRDTVPIWLRSEPRAKRLMKPMLRLHLFGQASTMTIRLPATRPSQANRAVN